MREQEIVKIARMTKMKWKRRKQRERSFPSPFPLVQK